MQMRCAGRHRPAVAAATGRRQVSLSARCTLVRASKKQVQEATSNSSQDDTSSRRHLLSAGVLAAAAASLSAERAQAAAPACTLQSSPNGLQFCDITEGSGAEPVKGALIRCHYTGRLASNGRVFDSSYERGRPLTFKVGVHEVISGWDLGILGGEGVPPMKEGGKRLLLIPSDLAYGSRGAGGVIPPNAQLEFEVELLGKRR